MVRALAVEHRATLRRKPSPHCVCGGRRQASRGSPSKAAECRGRKWRADHRCDVRWTAAADARRSADGAGTRSHGDAATTALPGRPTARSWVGHRLDGRADGSGLDGRHGRDVGRRGASGKASGACCCRSRRPRRGLPRHGRFRQGLRGRRHGRTCRTCAADQVCPAHPHRRGKGCGGVSRHRLPLGPDHRDRAGGSGSSSRGSDSPGDAAAMSPDKGPVSGMRRESARCHVGSSMFRCSGDGPPAWSPGPEAQASGVSAGGAVGAEGARRHRAYGSGE
jgi:hypothetical protein